MTDDKSARLSYQPWGTMPDGTPVDAYTLRAADDVEVQVITLGGIITSVRMPDSRGRVADVVHGHDHLAGYVPNPRFFGAIIGRYANRIGGGRFTLDGQTYTLAQNNNVVNHLHGGVKGWNQAVWRAEPFERAGEAGVVLRHTSPDGDEGYPGAVQAEVVYLLRNRELSVQYRAVTDQPTIINLTQHTYFNLGGAEARDILDHEVMINADRYTPVDDTLIPTGELADVSGTPFDFRASHRVGERIDQDHVQLQRARGYDHNWVLNRESDDLSLAARVVEPSSGRTLHVWTTEPGMQFYAGNFLDGSIMGKGRQYGKRSGFCLETQHFPDSPNKPHFPSTVLRPGQEYRSTTLFQFGAEQ